MRSLLWIAATLATVVFLGTGDASARGGRGGCGGGCGGRGHLFGGRHHGGCGYDGGCGHGGCGSHGCGSGCYSGCGTCGSASSSKSAALYDDASGTAVAEADEDTATLVVKVPADARLYINDQATKSTSSVRVLQTPRVPVGGEYHYTLRVEVTRNGETQTVSKVVNFRAGQEKHVTVDLPTEAVASR
jgi:uncharacterized protein (TIGR03000 family)